MKLLIASGNRGKIREFSEILSQYGIEVCGAAEAGIAMDVEEDGTTFFENAYKKAHTIAQLANTPVLADDSGLCVYSLLGEPGVYSARYSGEGATDEKNNALLLEKMRSIPQPERGGKFVCSIVVCFPDGSFEQGYGETYGRILTEESGQGGFGYDPLFYSFDLNQSFGDAPQEEKNKVSHRARAISEIIPKICARLACPAGE